MPRYACRVSATCAPVTCAPTASRSAAQALQVELHVLDEAGGWREVAVPAAVRAIIFLNLQSYAGGRDLWKHSAQVRPSMRRSRAWL